MLLVVSRSVFLQYYPGLLVSTELLTRFEQRYYCPTALRLPSLDYIHNSNCVKMWIIGDPTSAGAIVNDGVRSGHPGLCNALRAALRVYEHVHARVY